MYKQHELGVDGENIAVQYFQKNKYRIIEKNFRCKQGEIDIIVYDETTEEIVFVEVKTRSNLEYGTPAMAVNRLKRKHLKSSANIYIYQNKLYKYDVRFDVIEIIINNGKCNINHIKEIM